MKLEKEISVKDKGAVSSAQSVCFEIFPKPKEQQGISLGSLIKGIHQMKTEFKGFEGNTKGKTPFTFEMCFERNRYRFLATCPRLTAKTLQNKFKQAWEGADTLEVDLPDEVFDANKSVYADVVMGKKGVLPLSFNANGELMKSNEPLSSLTSVAKTLTKKEAFMVQYVLLPLGPKMQTFQRAMAQNTIDDLKNGAPEELTKVAEQVFKAIGADVNSMLDEVLEGIFEQKTTESKARSKSYLEATSNNKAKLDQMVSKNAGDFFRMRIRVFVKAPNPNRRNELLYEVYSALKTIEGYNQLKLTPSLMVKDSFPFQRHFKSDRQLKHFNHVSSKELHTLLAPPSKAVLAKNQQIRQIASEEVKLSNAFYHGTIPLGVIDPLNPRLVFQPTKNLEVFMLPKVLLGPPGSGKTTYLIWYVLGLMKLEHNVFIFDYIKNAELTKEITGGLPESMYEVWDFSDEAFASTFSLSYPEVYWEWTQEDFQMRYDIADKIKDHISKLLEALNEGKALGLTAQMERTLGAVAKAVFVHKEQTLYQFYQVLTDYDVRKQYIAKGLADRNAEGISILDDDDIAELERLNETQRVKNPDTGEWEEIDTGETNTRMIESIANRMYVFFKNNRIKRIAKNPVTDKYSLFRIFKEHKMVMVRTPQSYFSEEIRSSIVSFLTLKIWLVKEAGKIEGVDDETPAPCPENPDRQLKDKYCTHLIYDEVHQIKPALRFLSSKIKEFRKFRICPMVTSHNLEDFGKENLQNFESCQPTYMFLTTPHQKSLEVVQKKLDPLVIDDILKLPKYYSVNIVSTDKETYVFVAKSLGGKKEAIAYYTKGELKLPSLADSVVDDLDEDDEWEYETPKRTWFKNPFRGIRLKRSEPNPLEALIPSSPSSSEEELTEQPLTIEVGDSLRLEMTEPSTNPKSTVEKKPSIRVKSYPSVRPISPLPISQLKRNEETEEIEKKEEKEVFLAPQPHIMSQEEKREDGKPTQTIRKKGGSFMNQKELFQNLMSSAVKEAIQDDPFTSEEKKLLAQSMSETETKELIKESTKVFNEAFANLLNGQVTKENSQEVLGNLSQMMERIYAKQKEVALATHNETLIQKMNTVCESQLTEILTEKPTTSINEKADLTWVGFDESTKVSSLKGTTTKINYSQK